MMLHCKGCGGNLEYSDHPLRVKGWQMGIKCPLCNAWNTLVFDFDQGLLISIDEWIAKKVKDDR